MREASLRQWKTDVLEHSSDRFERRLSEELGTFRTETARDFAAVRVEMARNHASLLRWMFVFWVGQAGITLGLVAMMLRAAKLP